MPAGNESCLVCDSAIAVCLGVCMGVFAYMCARVFGCHYLFSFTGFLKVASSQPGDKNNTVVCVFARGE